MVDHQGKNLVFILSTPRSGSTLLGALLGSHGRTFCPPEPWFLLSLDAIRSNEAMVISRYDHELGRRALNELVDDPLFHQAAGAFARKIYNALLRQEQKEIFVDKTPRYYHILHFIDALFPLAHKIWIKRNPLDVIASYRKTWGHSIDELLGDILSPYSFDATISYSLLSSYFEKDDSKKIVVCYEDLVKDPRTHMHALCEFLNLEFEEEILEYGRNRSLMNTYQSRYMGDKKILEHHRPHNHSIGRWRGALTRKETKKVLQTFGSNMFDHLGYGELMEESMALTNITAGEISDDGQFARLFSQYHSYVDTNYLKFGDIRYTLISRQHTQLLKSLAHTEVDRTTCQQENEVLTQKIHEQEQEKEALKQEIHQQKLSNDTLKQEIQKQGQDLKARKQDLEALNQDLEDMKHERNTHLEIIRHLMSSKGAAKMLFARCLLKVGLYDFGKRWEARLIRLLKPNSDKRLPASTQPVIDQGSARLNVVVAHCEINEKHGVGILLKRIFADEQNILSIRSVNLYHGEHDFGTSNVCISHKGLTKSDVLIHTKKALGKKVPGRILAVPYYPDDVLTSIALKDLSNAPLCTYIMDDQNIGVNKIPDADMKELLEKSDLRFAISKDLCDAYEQKYHQKFWFFPPTVEGKFIQYQHLPAKIDDKKPQKGILIGNIWSQQWLNRLRTTLKGAGIRIDWYGNPNREWLSFEDHELDKDGITFKGFVPQERLIQRLRKASFAVVPTANSTEAEDRPEISKFSLPSRLPYLLAIANIPVIVVGRKDSGAAKFVQWLQVGSVCDYEPQKFVQVVDHICSSQIQREIRQRAARLAPCFSADGMAKWMWRSLEKGEPWDHRFENLGRAVDIVITLNEINQKHGTGALMKRIFPSDTHLFSIRSCNHYHGNHRFGEFSLCLPKMKMSRSEVAASVSNALKGMIVKRVFCVPYHAEELLTALSIKEIYDAPLATYIMDDQNIFVKNIPDKLMREFLHKCTLRLGTHPEICHAYEEKYGLKFWILPAIVPHHLLQHSPQQPKDELTETKTGALIGSIWSKRWFDMLCHTIDGSEIKLDWYGNTDYLWLTDTSKMLQEKGLCPHGIVPEDQLVERLRTYPYIVIPTGTLDRRDDRSELSRLSLPGRILFVLATSNTPIILLGNQDTCAGRFIQHFNVGIISDYDPHNFRHAVNHILCPEVQRKIRQRAASVAKDFSAKNITEWVWHSLEKGQAADLRFEKLMPYSVDTVQ